MRAADLPNAEDDVAGAGLPAILVDLGFRSMTAEVNTDRAVLHASIKTGQVWGVLRHGAAGPPDGTTTIYAALAWPTAPYIVAVAGATSGMTHRVSHTGRAVADL